MGAWEPSRYLRYEEERTRPCIDLVRRIDLEAPRRIVDLGCGPGNSTAVLRDRWPRAHLTGIDSSSEMLARARASPVDATWKEADLRTWSPRGKMDLVFSNAALQWVPNHQTLIPRLLDRVASGGALAFQVPANDERPGSWRAALARVVHRARWRARFPRPPALPRTESLATYYELLAPRSRRLDLWDTQYVHIMDGPEAIVDWVRGTGLRPWLDRLSDERERAAFLADLGRSFAREYPARSDDRTLFPFLRRFVVAHAR